MLGFKKFPWFDDIQFDDFETIEGKTRYYLTPSGKLPSMTSVLSILDDGGIEKWKKRVGEEEANRIAQEASDRGNKLHDLNELYLKNQLSRDMITGQGGVLFNRVKRYLDEVQAVMATEVALYNDELGYAGRVDCICMMEDNITILDHKNSSKAINLDRQYARRKLFKYMLQCVGYSLALERMKGVVATHGCLIVGNHKASGADKFYFELEPLKEEFYLLVKAYKEENQKILKNSMYFSL